MKNIKASRMILLLLGSISLFFGLESQAGAALPVVTLHAADGTMKDEFTTEQWQGDASWSVSRSGGNLSLPLTVKYDVGGTATPGVDYKALSGVAIIPAGASKVEFSTRAVRDSEVESDESIIVKLLSDASYVIGKENEAIGYVIDLSKTSQPKPEITVTAQSDGTHDDRTTELNQGYAYWHLFRSGNTDCATTVNYVVSGTATPGLDYVKLSGSVVIPAGESGVLIKTRALPDSLTEPDETIVVTLTDGAWYNIGSANSATCYVIDLPPVASVPDAPVELSVTVDSANQLTLAWKDQSKNENGFKIERKKGNTGGFLEVASVGMNVESYHDQGLEPGSLYYYRVRAFNKTGNSENSMIVAGTTQKEVIETVPTGPDGLSVSVISTSQLNLTWNDRSANETGFKIERRKGSTGGFTQIANVGANVKSYSNNGLPGGTLYAYRVRAMNAQGNSEYSNIASGTTLKNVIVTLPDRPTGLSVTTVSSSQLNLTWSDQSNNETGFRIERREGNAGSFMPIATVQAGVESYQNSGLAANTQYFYRVRSTNSKGNSAYSNMASGLTDRVIPAPKPPPGSPPIATLARNPFNMWSAHHRPIGADAEAGIPGGTLNPRAKTIMYDQPGPINSRGRLNIVGAFFIGPEAKPILTVKDTDPYHMVVETRKSGKKNMNLPTPSPGLRFPRDTTPLPSSGDGEVGLYPRNGVMKDILDVFFQFRYPRYSATRRASYPLGGTDVWEDSHTDRSPSASAIRVPSGVLLGDEVNSSNPAPIYHALNATATRHCSVGATPDLHVLNRKMVWPAYGVDAYHITPQQDRKRYDNQGDIPYGTVIFIRPQDYKLRDTLGLNDRQKAIFDVFCYYGCRLVDGQGQTVVRNKVKKAVLQLRTDGELSKDAKKDVSIVLNKILPHLYPLRNPRTHKVESEVWTDGLPYAGGGGPINPTKSVNNAWDAKPANH